MNQQFTVNKANVYKEVAKTTSYAGAKRMASDASAYDRIRTLDEDRIMLERFWKEAGDAVIDLFKPFLVDVSDQSESHCYDLTGNFSITADLPARYDDRLNGSVSSSLYHFFVYYVCGKWYEMTDNESAANNLTMAQGLLDDVRGKIYYKKKPHREDPTSTNP